MATRKPEPMCCVSVGYQDFLMSMEDGMRFIKLMQNVMEVDREYDGDYVFIPKTEQPKIEMKMVKANQIRGAQKRPTLMLGNG